MPHHRGVAGEVPPSARGQEKPPGKPSDEPQPELRVDADDQLTEALDQLVRWGNLRADVDTSRVTTVEDFHRKRSLYQLTAAGQAAEQAIAFYEEAIGRRGQLQSVALADIAGQLRALLVLAGESHRSLAEAQQAAADFLGHYRRYAKVAAKRKAAGPRLTQSRYEQLGRDLAAAEEAFAAAQQALDEAQRELTQGAASSPRRYARPRTPPPARAAPISTRRPSRRSMPPTGIPPT